MSQSVISRMLRREVATDMQVLERLAKALGKPLPELQAVPDPSPPRARVVREGTTSRDSPNSAHVLEGASSPSLTGDQIAKEVAEVLAPLVEQLAAKGESVVARWLLAVAGEANDQSVDNVRPLIDLARLFLWRAEQSRL